MKGKLVFRKGERPMIVLRNAKDSAGDVDATDAARALAIEEKGDGADAFLATVAGTGKDGRVTVGDVRAALDGEQE